MGHTAALVALYTGSDCSAAYAVALDVITILPPPCCRRMALMARFTKFIVPLMLTSMTLYCGSSSSPAPSKRSSRKSCASEIPALAIAMSMWSVCLKTVRRSCQDVMSHCVNLAPRGISSSLQVRSRMVTWAPFEVNILAVARPMPEAPPALGR